MVGLILVILGLVATKILLGLVDFFLQFAVLILKAIHFVASLLYL